MVHVVQHLTCKIIISLLLLILRTGAGRGKTGGERAEQGLRVGGERVPGGLALEVVEGGDHRQAGDRLRARARANVTFLGGQSDDPVAGVVPGEAALQGWLGVSVALSGALASDIGSDRASVQSGIENFIRRNQRDDILLVQVNPVHRDEVSRTSNAQRSRPERLGELSSTRGNPLTPATPGVARRTPGRGGAPRGRHCRWHASARRCVRARQWAWSCGRESVPRGRPR